MPVISRQLWVRAAGLALSAAVVLNACGGGSGGPDPVSVRTVTTLTVSPADVTLKALGAIAQLEATARDQNGNPLSAQFSWSTSEASIVTVDADGLVTAFNNGTATVTVRSGSVSGSATVTVEQAPSRLALSRDEVMLTALGANVSLEASVFDANDNAMSGELIWASSEPAVASVDGEGTITSQANGTATVTAAIGSVSGSVSVTVQQAVSAIRLEPEAVTLVAIDQRAQFKATALDANGHPVAAEIDYTSTEPAVATIDDQGLLIARRNGMTTVSASTGAVSTTATVTVRQVLAGIALAPDAVELSAIGQSAQLQVMAVDANGIPMVVDMSLSSSDPAVASVNAEGLVTAQANGTATVTAAAGSVSGSATVRVDQRVASVSLSAVDSSTLGTVGATVQLQAVARDANGHTVNVEFAWASSDPSVATVDAIGLVTAQGDGVTEIRAFSGGFSDALTLELALRRAARVVLTPPSSLLQAFEATVQLSVEVLDADGQAFASPVAWASSDPGIVTVDASGLITARGNGTATITAHHGEAAGTATVKVLQRIRQIQIAPEGQFLDPVLFSSLGETVQFTAEAFDANGHAVAGVVFTASPRETGVVSIDDRLLATAMANGDTIVDFVGTWAGRSPQRPNAVRVRQVAASIDIEPTARTFRNVRETHQFTAVAEDANGHALPANFLLWETADRRIAEVDTTGRVSIAGVGETTVTAFHPEGLSASATVIGELQTTCDDGDRTPSITSVAPASLVEGTAIEIHGQGFCSDSAGNLATVDRMLAPVRASSETRLTVTVPQFDCLPSREIEVGVAVGANRATRRVRIEPDEPAISVPVGRQAIWGAAQDKCLQFPAEAGEETYVIGVHSTSLEPSYDLTPVRLIASTSQADASAPAATTPRTVWPSARVFVVPATATAAGGPVIAPLAEEPALNLPVRSTETQLPPVESHDADPIAAGTLTFPDQGDIESLPEEGALVTIPDSSATWVLYKVGTHALWLVDTNFVERMEAEFPGRIKALSEAFDNGIYPVISDYFGAPDLGIIDRVIITTDARGGANVVGKEGRRWHRIQLGVWVHEVTLAHEFVHVVQIAGLEGGPHPRKLWRSWLLEGHAQFGEEQYALVQSNRTTGQNYGRSVVYDNSPLEPGWRSNLSNLPNFFGGAHPERPQECSWLAHDPSPCRARNLFYFVGWSLNRWLTDQYGRLYPGGEANLHRQLIHGPDDFRVTIEQQMGESMETLLARWAAALYVDDRIPNLDPDLQFTSWNFYDIYRDNPERLMPLEIGFSDQEHRARIRDGSFWYVHVSGSQRPASAIRIRDLADRELPDDMQVWVVRLQ